MKETFTYTNEDGDKFVYPTLKGAMTHQAFNAIMDFNRGAANKRDMLPHMVQIFKDLVEKRGSQEITSHFTNEKHSTTIPMWPSINKVRQALDTAKELYLSNKVPSQVLTPYVQ